MNIKKIPEGGIKIESTAVICADPQKITAGTVAIITDEARNINHDRIFNLPGEYELQGVIIKGFGRGPYVFLVKDEISLLYFTGDLNEAVLDEIKTDCSQVEVVLSNQIKDPAKLQVKVGAAVFVTTEKPAQLNSIKTEKTNSVKINSRKLAAASYYLQ